MGANSGLDKMAASYSSSQRAESLKGATEQNEVPDGGFASLASGRGLFFLLVQHLVCAFRLGPRMGLMFSILVH
jgi:hypothetical protein